MILIIPKMNTITNKEDLRLITELNKTRSKWPATIFAANRTAKVIGRIKELTSSTKTIKGKRALGVFKGTRCAKVWLGVLAHALNVYPTHKGTAIDAENNKCLEAGKT